MDTSYAVFCGIDVGKSEHHAVGLAADGTRLYDKPYPTTRLVYALCSTVSQCTGRC